METATIDRPPPTGEGLTFEKVWAMFQETELQIKELRNEMYRITQEIDRINKKRPEYTTETSPQIEDEETLDDEESRWVEEINEEIYKKYSNDFGNLSDYLVKPFIERKFSKLGFNWICSRKNYSVRDPENSDDYISIDIMLEDKETAIAINIKEKVDKADVDEHIKRMEILRRDADKRQCKRKYRGAIAAVEIDEAVREYMLQKGLYMLKQTGETIKIDIPEGFVPREF